MKIKIEVTKSNYKKRKEEVKKDENTKEKENIIEHHIRHMSLTKKIIYGSIATFLAARAIDNLTEKQYKEVPNQVQYENTTKSSSEDEIAKHDEQIKVIDPIPVEAKEVLNDYANATSYEEQKSVDALYKNQYLEVNGIVNEIVDQDTLTLDNENTNKWYSEWMSIECNFTEQTDLEKLQELQTGDQINIVGYCNGYDGLTVEMDNCTFK
jgi:hypothetical protein